jgi:hypothetical protein
MSRNDTTVQSAVTRTMRAAIKVGDDYYTLEETITLPPNASDDQIKEAVATGFRIYEAQREAVDAQARGLREHMVAHPIPVQIREPDAPASEKQRAYMDYLLKELNWDNERLAAFAADRMLNVLTLTKREASELIDELKGLLTGSSDSSDDEGGEEAEEPEPEPQRQPILPIGERATQRQVRALQRLAEERAIDLDGELRARYGGRALEDLSLDEAGQLLSEWQQRPRQIRPQALRRAA